MSQDRQPVPTIRVADAWQQVLEPPAWDELRQALPGFLQQRRWFGSKTRTIAEVVLQDRFQITADAVLALIEVRFAAGEPELYVLPLTVSPADQEASLCSTRLGQPIARLSGERLLHDALVVPDVCTALLNALVTRQTFDSGRGTRLACVPFTKLAHSTELTPVPGRVEQSNTSIRFGQSMILKIIRRIEPGLNPEVEIGRFLVEHTKGAPVPTTLGAIDYQRDGASMSVGVLQQFVPNRGDAWAYTIDVLEAFLRRQGATAAPAAESFWQPSAAVVANEYLESARLLGRRTAELHLALTSADDVPDFAPEPFRSDDQEACCRSAAALAQNVLEQLRSQLGELPASARAHAERLLAEAERLGERWAEITRRPLTACRARLHGDYHLGQVLYTGSDFLIIDFEGEPARPLAERRQKHSPLRDVAGMIRSFHYAVYTALGRLDEPARRQAEGWGQFWFTQVASAFIAAYRQTAGSACFIPQTQDEFRMLVEVFLLEKAIYEVGYELNHRPDWVAIPLLGINQILTLAAD